MNVREEKNFAGSWDPVESQNPMDLIFDLFGPEILEMGDVCTSKYCTKLDFIMKTLEGGYKNTKNGRVGR